ncbi:MAG: RepB family DNA primase [Chloroflexi bacterium]|nr:RepB family DNA primase [Chloroflexota bacterium]
MTTLPNSPLPLLQHLWRGGGAAYYWRANDQRSQWFPAGAIAENQLGDTDVYFGVHPTREPGGEFERAKILTVACINCLFSEWDAKDFDNDPSKVREHIKALSTQPQVIIASGGGYHGYWLIQEPVMCDGPTTADLIAVQRGWVNMTGGDKGAKDLARILRLPGTLNAKYDPPRLVQFVRFDLDKLYSFEELHQAAKPHMRETPPDEYAPSQGPIAKLLAAYKQAVNGERNTYLFWTACRLYDYGLSFAGVKAELFPIAVSKGLDETNVLSTLRSAAKTARKPIRSTTQQPTRMADALAQYQGAHR